MTDQAFSSDQLLQNIPLEDDADDQEDEGTDPSAAPPSDPIADPQTADDQAKKTANKHEDPRHLRRIALMQQLFAYTFHDDEARKNQFIQENPDVAEVIAQLDELDQQIQSAATERPLAQVNKVDLAVLRLIMFEWKTSRTPKKVLIDEAVELAKEFGTESSPRFVNGVLAQLIV